MTLFLIRDYFVLVRCLLDYKRKVEIRAIGFFSFCIFILLIISNFSLH